MCFTSTRRSYHILKSSRISSSACYERAYFDTFWDWYDCIMAWLIYDTYSCLGPIRLSDGSHESSVLWEHTPAAAVPYLGLGAEISLVGYVLKTPPVGILDVPCPIYLVRVVVNKAPHVSATGAVHS